MPNLQQTKPLDESKLNTFIGQILSDLGGASSVALVRMGDALGLYRTLHGKGPMTSAELARSAKVDERYLREWLSHQVASNYLSYEPESARFSLPPEQAMVIANEDSPVYMMGGFDLMAALLDNQPKVQAAFKTGTGGAWGDQAACMFCAVARFFRHGYHNNLVPAWLPALDGVVKRLLAQHRSHAREQRLMLERLGQIVVGARVQTLDDISRIGFCGDKDDRDRSQRNVLLEYAHHTDAIELRHHDIEQDQVRPKLARSRQPLFAIRCGHHFVAVCL